MKSILKKVQFHAQSYFKSGSALTKGTAVERIQNICISIDNVISYIIIAYVCENVKIIFQSNKNIHPLHYQTEYLNLP